METTRNRPSRSSNSRGNRSGSAGGNRNHRSSRSGGSRSGYQGGKTSSFFGASSRRSPRKMPSFDPSQFINANPVNETEEVYKPTHKFSEFGLNEKLVRTLASTGIQSPTPIQDQIIPEILDGKDVVGIAETGTGKTAAFLLPLIDKTLREYSRQTLILTPTRELAIQIEAELMKLSAGQRIYSVTCVGGTSIRPQIQKLRRQNHFVIGTPGRIMDLMERRHFKPENISTVVLDEADRMLDMGFINPIKEILSTTPKDRETLFFSATMDDRTKGLVSEFLHDPVMISVKKRESANSIKQNVVKHGHHDKFETLTNLFKDDALSRVIIFGAMKHSVEKLSKQLSAAGIKSESIHGNKTHPQRQRSLNAFKSGNSRVLVATDVAARGIHVDNVSHVINYDLPNTYEDYIHRIGRTGRGKERGEALTFIASK